MEFKIMDEDFNIRYIVDAYESFIWTIRAKEAGDFELYMNANTELLALATEGIEKGWYVFCEKFYDKENDRANLMIIETVEVESDVENGAKMKITGRDLKEILTRRIVIGQKTFKTGTAVSTIIQTLLEENFTQPVTWTKTYQDSIYGDITVTIPASDRIISNFVINIESGSYETLTGELQLNGEDIYSIISDICDNYKIFYDLKYNFTTNNFEFYLYHYKDKTYDQNDLPPIIFSPMFENLKDSNYLESSSAEKTFGFIIGEGDENNAMYNVINTSDATGLKRKEVSISATDVNKIEEDTGQWYGNRDYLNMLLEKGKSEMKNNDHIKSYEGTAETSRGYSYPEDFDIGDIIEIINEWNISSKVLISEVILSVSETGISIIPTFSTITEEEGGET